VACKACSTVLEISAVIHGPEYTLRDEGANSVAALRTQANARRSSSPGGANCKATEVVSQLCPPPGKRSLLRASPGSGGGRPRTAANRAFCRAKQSNKTNSWCRLTLRSSGRPPARHLGREASSVIIRLAAQAPCRRPPLSSNVRRQIRRLYMATREEPRYIETPAPRLYEEPVGALYR
jgi:hypothetical protein